MYVFDCQLPLFSLCTVSKSSHYRDEKVIKAFGNRVRTLRQDKGMTIESLANQIDIGVTQLSRIERGEVNCSISYIQLLATTFKISLSQLMDFPSD